MNQAISVELKLFLISVLSGGILLLVYDLLRIIRRLIKQDSFLVALEDLFFWVGASLFIFAMMYRENNGVIRGFIILGMAIGMILYHNMFGDFFVDLIVKLIRTLISPFVFALKKIKQFILYIWNKGVKVMNFILRQLKKRTKSVKIALDKRKLASSSKKQKNQEYKLRKKEHKQNRTDRSKKTIK